MQLNNFIYCDVFHEKINIKMTYKHFLVALITLVSLTSYSQELKIEADLINPSKTINDGQIELHVTGGQEPYKYKWSNPDTPLSSSVSTSLVEGMIYTILVTDANGLTQEATYEITAESITEKMNGTLKPAVDALGSVLFWDPFAALGIYDPVMYADSKTLFAPGWEAGTKNKFRLEKWLVEKGEHVNEGDLVAVVSRGKLDDTEVKATVSGELKHLVEEGEVIYNPEKKSDVILQNAHKYAEIKYDEPIAILNANGTKKQRNSIYCGVAGFRGYIFYI